MNDPTCGRKHANSIKTEKLDWYHKYSAIIEMNDAGVETTKCVFRLLNVTVLFNIGIIIVVLPLVLENF